MKTTSESTKADNTGLSFPENQKGIESRNNSATYYEAERRYRSAANNHGSGNDALLRLRGYVALQTKPGEDIQN